MQIRGILEWKSELVDGVSKRGNTYQRQDIIITEQKRYGDKVMITVLNENVGMLNGLELGMPVVATFDMKVQDINGRKYQNCSLYRIARDYNPPMEQQQVPQQVAQQVPQQQQVFQQQPYGTFEPPY